MRQFLICLFAVAISMNPSVSESSTKKEFSDQIVCRAAIAAIMGRSPSIVKVIRVSDDVVYLRYVRPDDRSVWSYRCRLDGQRVVWAAEPGRWRNHPDDEEIFFETTKGGSRLKIVEKYSDGSNREKVYSRDQLFAK